MNFSNFGDLKFWGTKYKTLYIDPPWQYGNKSTRNAAENHYSTMSIKELKAMPVQDIIDPEGAHLHMWTTNAFLKDAIDTMEKWGFSYKSCFVWTKPQMGMGNYWRVSHEFMLFGHTKMLKFKRRDAMSWLMESRQKHSQKPEIVRSIIEQVSPGPYLEMFSRTTASGWDLFGNEVGKYDPSFALPEKVDVKNPWHRFFNK